MVVFETLLLLMAIVLFAYAIKGIVGFGEGLITTSLFLLLFDLKFVLPITLLLALIGGFYQAYNFRKEMNLKIIASFIIPMIIGLIAGTYFLNVISGSLLKRIFAVFVILYSFKVLFFRKSSRVIKRRGVIEKPLGVFSGLLDGLIGVGGVPIIIYFDYLSLKKSVFRATIVAGFIVLAAGRTITYSLSGLINLEILKITAYLLPAAVIGSLIGMKIHHKLDEMVFKRMVGILLLLIGVINLL